MDRHLQSRLVMTANVSVTRSERGFSLLEVLFVIAIIAVVTGMSVFQLGAAQPWLKGDGAMRALLGQMRTARELAIAQRRCIRMVFVNPATVQLVREEVPGPATTVVGETTFEGGVIYSLVDGLPDTPDAFGNPAPVSFGVVVNIKFSPDGTLMNQDGEAINGTVFLAIPTVSRSARALTVLGSTGRIRSYRWDGGFWRLV
jgi:prepilin-type N-terminal cleavage/methylation domain-containing protein